MADAAKCDRRGEAPTPTQVPQKRQRPPIGTKRQHCVDHSGGLPPDLVDVLRPVDRRPGDPATLRGLSRVRTTAVGVGVREVRVGGRLVAIDRGGGDVLARPDFSTMKAVRRRGADELAAIRGLRNRGYSKAQMDLVEWFRARGGRLATTITRSYATNVLGVTGAELDALIRDGVFDRRAPALPVDPKGRPTTAPMPMSGVVDATRRGRCGETAATCPLFAERGLGACGPCPLKHERFPLSVGRRQLPRA